MLEKRQTLEEKKFRLQQEELRLNLEAEMVKATAKERVYAAMTSPSVPEVKPSKLETELQDQDPLVPAPARKGPFQARCTTQARAWPWILFLTASLIITRVQSARI